MLSRYLPATIGVLVFSTSVAWADAISSNAAKARSFPIPPIRARAGVVMDADSNTVLASVNPHLRLPMASTTKLMTAVVALQRGHLSDVIRVPRAAFNYEWDATVMGLRPGQRVSLQDLLYGLMLPSGADAANTIAIHYGKTEAGFVRLMNQEATRLGMRDTHYINAHGLTAADHHTSAFDLATLGVYASHIKALMAVARTRAYNWNGRTLVNLNHVLFWYRGVDGIKPGYTDDAGICQVLHASKHGRHIVVALLNTPNLVYDARDYLNFGLRDFVWNQSALAADIPSAAQTGIDRYGAYVYYPGSGHYLRGALYHAFVKDGGLGVLGFPRTEVLREGGNRVQYFQNGELALKPSGSIGRLPLGTSLVASGYARGWLASGPALGHLGRRIRAQQNLPPPPGPTPTPVVPQQPAGVFKTFYRQHASLLGKAITPLLTVGRYRLQLFTYGGAVNDPSRKTNYLLPVGDRYLGLNQYLPPYPGNVYPRTFAPISILKAISWIPTT